MTETVTAHEIEIVREYDAPRDLVWRAWTDPDRLVQWWGPRGWSALRETVTLDVRVGGTFRLVSVRDEDGAEMPTDAVFTEVVVPERLAFTEAVDAGCDESHGADGVVTFSDLGGGRTRMHFRTRLFTTDENHRHAEAGLTSAFERLDDLLT